MSDLGLAYQEYDFYEELFEKPKRIKRKKEPVKKFQLNLRRIQARGPNQQLAGMAGNETPKIPAVPVAPVHAGRCAKTPRTVYLWLARIIH